MKSQQELYDYCREKNKWTTEWRSDLKRMAETKMDQWKKETEQFDKRL